MKSISLIIFIILAISCKKAFQPTLAAKLNGGWELTKIEIDGVDSTIYNNDSLNIINVIFFNSDGKIPTEDNYGNGYESRRFAEGKMSYINKDGIYHESVYKYAIGTNLLSLNFDPFTHNFTSKEDSLFYGSNGKFKRIGGVNNWFLKWEMIENNGSIMTLQSVFNNKTYRKHFIKKLTI